MRAVIIYESMYGNTHLIADAIARGLEPGNEVTVVPVARATRDLLDEADLVVAGGPTHVHGMSQARTRQAAVEASKGGGRPSLDPDAEGRGLGDWFGSLGPVSALAAAFDTRLAGPAVVTGRASKRIARLLGQHGFTVIARPNSFLVTTDSQLRPSEEDRARDWGKELAAKLAAAEATSGERQK
jgi:Flavodoxin